MTGTFPLSHMQCRRCRKDTANISGTVPRLMIQEIFPRLEQAIYNCLIPCCTQNLNTPRVLPIHCAFRSSISLGYRLYMTAAETKTLRRMKARKKALRVSLPVSSRSRPIQPENIHIRLFHPLLLWTRCSPTDANAKTVNELKATDSPSSVPSILHSSHYKNNNPKKTVENETQLLSSCPLPSLAG